MYQAAIKYGQPYVRETVRAVFEKNNLDAIVYPTSPRRPAKIEPGAPAAAAEGAAGGGSATNFANFSGFPDLIIPAGFTPSGLPIGISFFGTSFSEGKLLGLGYAYEQASKALRVPVNTPALPGEKFEY